MNENGRNGTGGRNSPKIGEASEFVQRFLVTNIPYVMDLDGNFDEKPSFQYGTKTEVFWSCGTTLNGDFYIFGGFHEKRQVFFDGRTAIL